MHDGRDLVAALPLGAKGIYMGTRVIATQESDFAQGYKDAEEIVRKMLQKYLPRLLSYPVEALTTKLHQRVQACPSTFAPLLGLCVHKSFWRRFLISYLLELDMFESVLKGNDHEKV